MNLVSISKSMSYLLRHKAIEEKINIRPDGFAPVSEIIGWLQISFSEITIDSIKTIVNNDKKNRYTIKTIDGVEYIRANQGHSFSVPELDLKLITDVKSYGVILHASYWKHKTSMEASGIDRRSREHIHMTSTSNPKWGQAIRQDINMFVIVNVELAIKDGFKFYESANNVILCSGNQDGFIPSKYLVFVARKKTPCSGVVVYGYDKANNPYLAVVKTPKNHLSYPKGKREKHENSFETAIRELEEETGIIAGNLEFDNFPVIQEETKKGNVSVSYYVARYKPVITEFNLVPVDANELVEAKWRPFQEISEGKFTDANMKPQRIEISHKISDLVIKVKN